MAACSQDSKQFGANLTSRNSAAFVRMTPAAQATLLKRFVLLDKPGMPRLENAEGGNLSVLCVTPEVTTQMQIGKTEVRDNLAYLPLVVKDVSDTTDANTRHVTMSLVRENNQWKLLSLGLLLLDLPTLGEEWDQAEIQANEKSAVASMKELASAVEKYRVTYTRLPQTLAELGAPAKGAPKSDQAGLLGTELAGGRKDGYSFRYVIVGGNNLGAPAKYELAAIPVEYGRTGTRSFFRDISGALHGSDHQGAVGTALDPKVE
ncbi:MAG: hypothetical protein WBL63_07835 [Candidatus Acidiferrum sp.]